MQIDSIIEKFISQFNISNEDKLNIIEKIKSDNYKVINKPNLNLSNKFLNFFNKNKQINEYIFCKFVCFDNNIINNIYLTNYGNYYYALNDKIYKLNKLNLLFNSPNLELIYFLSQFESYNSNNYYFFSNFNKLLEHIFIKK